MFSFLVSFKWNKISDEKNCQPYDEQPKTEPHKPTVSVSRSKFMQGVKKYENGDLFRGSLNKHRLSSTLRA